MQVRNDASSIADLSLDDRATAWLKSHTISDLRNMASQMKQHGEGTDDIQNLIDELDRMERETTSMMR